MATRNPFNQELQALAAVLDALGPLDEKARTFVLRTAIERLELSISVGNAGKGERIARAVRDDEDTDRNGGGSARDGETPSAKDFLKDKKPASDVQHIAVLAYYLTHYGDKDEFNTQDLMALNTTARGRRITNPTRAVDNATRSGGILIPGTGSSRMKRLSTHGEEVVDALPDQDAVKALLKTAKTPARRRTAKKGKGGRKTGGRRGGKAA